MEMSMEALAPRHAFLKGSLFPAKRWKSERATCVMRRRTSGDTYHDACLCNGHSDVSPGRTWWMRQPFNARGHEGDIIPASFFFFGCIRQNTAMEDEWRTTYLICGGRRSIYLSQTWGPARRRAADGWGSGRIWTGTGRTAPWLRSGCCSSAGVSLQGDRGRKRCAAVSQK